MITIQHAIWLYHRFPLSYRDVQELLYQRGIEVSIVVNGCPRGRHSSTRRCADGVSSSRPSSPKSFATGNPAGVPGSIWTRCVRASMASNTGSSWAERTRVLVRAARLTTLDRMSMPARWRAVDEHGFVLDILLQCHRDTEAAKTFLTRLLGEYDVPEVIHTDQLRSYGAAMREILSLINVDHQQVISTAHCNNLIEQSHRPTKASRVTVNWIRAEKTGAGVSQPARPNRESSPSSPHQRFRYGQKKQPEESVPDVVDSRGRGGLRIRSSLPSTCCAAS